MENKRRNQADLSGNVLKFEKRRYDGGSEIELIHYIESSYVNVATTQSNGTLSWSYAWPSQASQPENVTLQEALPSSPSGTVPLPKKTKSRVKQILEAVLIGPMEVAVGAIGILTSGLAILTFSQTNNHPMVHHSKVVLKECVNTLIKGVIDTAFSPIRVLKVAVVGI